MSEAVPQSGMVNEVRGTRRVLITALSRAVRWLQSTYRYEGWENAERVFRHSDRGCLILIWHNRILPAIGLFNFVGRGGRRIYTMASASRDGAAISCFLETQGIIPVRGSSSRRGGVAARELARALAAGHHVAITMDGPRGPLYQAHPGSAFLMQLTGAPAWFLGIEAEHCWQLPSWDRFIIPKPFSRVRIVADHLALPPAADRAAQRAELEAAFQQRLGAVTRDTHRLPQ